MMLMLARIFALATLGAAGFAGAPVTAPSDFHNFELTCTSIGLLANHNDLSDSLHAECFTMNQSMHFSSLDLNLCLGIDRTSGKLLFEPYGKYSEYCTACTFTNYTSYQPCGRLVGK